MNKVNFDKIISQKYGSNEIEYGIVKGSSNEILLIKVGQGGSIYGYENKYLKIAKHINDKYGIGAVVSSNPYDKTDSLEQAINLIKEEFGEVDIYYMGNSNGAILGARFGYLHPEIKRMLLINGPLMINWPQTKQGVQMFEGERIVFVYGSKDASFRYVELIKNLLVGEKIRLEIIEGTDHNFVGMDSEFLELAEKYLLSDGNKISHIL